MAKKLTTAQVAMLMERKGSTVASYRPFIALRDAGCIDVKVGSFGRVDWIISGEGEKRLNELAS